MNHKKRIAALFLNEFKEDTTHKIPGHDQDKKHTKKCLEQFGFRVDVHENKNKKETIDLLKEYASDDYSDADCFLCVFSSHGNEEGFETSDEKLIDLTSIILRIFTGNKSLNGKPKLFFIDACRGEKIMGTLENEPLPELNTAKGATKETSIPKICDIMIYYSTVPKYVSFTSSSGSKFIQAFLEVLNEYGKKEQLIDMVTRINQKIANYVLNFEDENRIQHFNCKQMSTLVEYSLRKRVFF